MVANWKVRLAAHAPLPVTPHTVTVTSALVSATWAPAIVTQLTGKTIVRSRRSAEIVWSDHGRLVAPWLGGFCRSGKVSGVACGGAGGVAGAVRGSAVGVPT